MTETAMSRIQARRKKAAESLTLDLAVPRYDPPIYVRFRPMEPTEMEAIEKRFRGLKDKDKTVIRNAAVLVEACLGLFEKDDESKPLGEGNENRVGLNGEEDPATWPRFDETLAEILGVDVGSAVDTVRNTYMTGYDIINTSVRVLEYSGLDPLPDEDDDSGN